jgi:hypothetical protein
MPLDDSPAELNQSTDSPSPLLTLEQLFGAASDEQAVLSVCATRSSPGDPWVLAHGTFLVVPEACAAISWPEWNHQQGAQHSPRVDPPLQPSLSAHDASWLLARQVCRVSKAEEWLKELWGQRPSKGIARLPELGCVPELQARLEMPKALARVVPGIDSPCSSLISGLGRPVQALMWANPEASRVDLPGQVEIEGHWSFMPSRDLAGIHLTEEGIDPAIATAPGLLVGRAERRAWLRDSRGEGEFRRYIVELGWDPSRIDISDLEITHIERINLDTVLANRIRLEDLDLAEVAGAGAVAIELPTLGRRVTHELVLSTLDGELLDHSGPYPLIERVEVGLEIDGEQQPPIVSGITDPPPELQARIERREEISAELREVIENGAQARILAYRSIAIERLTDLIERARGELLVMDRYFGQDTADWHLLDGVNVPVRVLTGKLAKDVDGEVVKATLGAQVNARFRPKAPIHDRIYIWEGGGLSIGGSPTSFGQAPLRLARLSAGEADIWRAEFETLWQSPNFSTVPRSDQPS